MSNIVLLTFDEINRIEDEYARKNKHKSYGCKTTLEIAKKSSLAIMYKIKILIFVFSPI